MPSSQPGAKLGKYPASRSEAVFSCFLSLGNSQDQGGEKSDTGAKGQVAKAMRHHLTAV